MGNCGSESQAAIRPSRELDVTSFAPDRVVGEGGFGRVVAVRMIQKGPLKGNFYAMKEFDKENILVRNRVSMVLNERQLLEKLRHPLLVNMHFAFQSSENLYLALDMCTGGDVHRELCRSPGRCFSEDRVRFYAASLVCALGYMHSQGVIHRDIKPENLLLDADGRLRVTDFGISERVGSDGFCRETSGTRPYMAPEVFLLGHEHSFVADYYSLGITLFQMLTGHRLYRPNQHVLRQLVRQSLYIPPKSVTSVTRARRILISAQDRKCTVPELKFSRKLKHVSDNCRDFILNCLICSPTYRLGARGVTEVLEHPWFEGLDIDAIAAGVAKPPVPASVNILKTPAEGPPPSLKKPDSFQVDVGLLTFQNWSYHTDANTYSGPFQEMPSAPHGTMSSMNIGSGELEAGSNRPMRACIDSNTTQTSPDVSPFSNTPVPRDGGSRSVASFASSDPKTGSRTRRASVHYSAKTIGNNSGGSFNMIETVQSDLSPNNKDGGSGKWSAISSSNPGDSETRADDRDTSSPIDELC